ncbi:hypothetical protein GBAR_LOCUS30121 [Geodia barretti]|uniref:Uncharacterized protein n=1 Tax=Geodia barretti TaxID=519541 RepID=A0AA35TWF6_GEOBA|nr:hypothetical protein GBAR_LOCUS30121 [Geodia barretti]
MSSGPRWTECGPPRRYSSVFPSLSLLLRPPRARDWSWLQLRQLPRQHASILCQWPEGQETIISTLLIFLQGLHSYINILW